MKDIQDWINQGFDEAKKSKENTELLEKKNQLLIAVKRIIESKNPAIMFIDKDGGYSTIILKKATDIEAVKLMAQNMIWDEILTLHEKIKENAEGGQN